MSAVSEPLRLRTLLATYPHTAPLKNGDVASARVALDFKDVTPVWSGFKAMVRRQEFDVSEMAIVTYLMAKSFGKLAAYPNFAAWLTRMHARPAFKRSVEKGGAYRLAG